MSLSRTLVLVINEYRELFLAYAAIMIGASTGILSCIAVNSLLNDRVIRTCNNNLNQIVVLKTIVGPSYGCVSRKLLHGPSPAIQP